MLEIFLGGIFWNARAIHAYFTVSGYFGIGFKQRDKKSIQDMVYKIGKNLKIEKQFEIENGELEDSCKPSGNNLFGKASLLVNTKILKKFSPEAQELLLTRGMAHIKENNLLKRAFIPGVVTVITILALSTLFPSLAAPSRIILSPAFMISMVIGKISKMILVEWIEKSADTIALKMSSNKAIEEIIQCLEKNKIKHQTSLPFSNLFYSSYDNRIAFFKTFIQGK